jgi:chromosome segregation ATPase
MADGLITALAVAGGALAAKAVDWATSRRKLEADEGKELRAELRAENKELKAEVDRLERAMEGLRGEIKLKDAELETLRGELRDERIKVYNLQEDREQWNNRTGRYTASTVTAPASIIEPPLMSPKRPPKK